MHLPLYVYSNKNIAGCVAGIAAVGAYLGGLIGDFWWAIVPGAYGVAALVTPAGRAIQVALEQQMSDAQILDGLQHLAAQAPGALPANIAANVVDICATLGSVIPMIAKKNMPDQAAHDVRLTATQYLPQTIEAYTRLPPAFRNIQKLQDGKTATQILDEQIALLRTHLQNVAEGLSADDAQALLTNGRFLREKFGIPDFIDVK